ncbi:MAG: hypothetical protein RL199_2062 [Pseudomonadota bacterium]|jgi:hypothetical protein
MQKPFVLSALLLAVGCSAEPGAGPERDVPAPAPDASQLDPAADGALPWHRDWTASPAVVRMAAPRRLFAVSDVHGGYDRLVALLSAAGLAEVSSSGHVDWTGDDAVLVVAGDSINKGTQSIEVLDFWMALQKSATAVGGRIVVLLGNHEAEFLADPTIAKAKELRVEIEARQLTAGKFASPATRWGRFLRSMPIAAVVGGWYFSHSGHGASRTMDALASEFRAAVEADKWNAPVLADDDSPLEANDWWSEAVVAGDLAAAGARHLVMGHDPHAFGEDGTIGAHFEGRLVHIDTGMSPAVDYSKGRLLVIDAPGTDDETVASLSHKGKLTALDMTQP